jgi:hypothetical protein
MDSKDTVQVEQEAQAEQEAQVRTPRDNAVRAFQAEFVTKHGPALADFMLVTRALEDVQRQVLDSLRNPPENKIARILLTAQAGDALARVEADLVVSVGILLGKKGDEISDFLALATEHHNEFFSLIHRFNPDGSPVEAANTAGGVGSEATPAPSIVTE